MLCESMASPPIPAVATAVMLARTLPPERAVAEAELKSSIAGVPSPAMEVAPVRGPNASENAVLLSFPDRIPAAASKVAG